MAKLTETTEVTRDVCDFCKEPQTYPARVCAICKRDMCSRGESNGDGHAVFSILKLKKMRERPLEEDVERARLYVCKECAKVTFNTSLGNILSGMMQEAFSENLLPFLVR